MTKSFGAMPVLTVRIHAGFNANAFLAGLLALTGETTASANARLKRLFPTTDAELLFDAKSVNAIAGVNCRFVTPTEPHHLHRTPVEILKRYDEESTLTPEAREKAGLIWHVLAGAEAMVHGATIETVHFHEVGRLSNILAIGLIADIVTELNLKHIVASPIPMADGTVQCAHGEVPYPAPSMFMMMKGLPVRPWAGTGEPVTPTGLAVLLGLKAAFGAWPAMTIEERVTVFTDREFEGVANGTLFAIGTFAPDVKMPHDHVHAHFHADAHHHDHEHEDEHDHAHEHCHCHAHTHEDGVEHCHTHDHDHSHEHEHAHVHGTACPCHSHEHGHEHQH